MYDAPDSLRLRPGRRATRRPDPARGSHATSARTRPATIMTAPGRVATSASTPYTTATVTPSAALSPTAPNAHAAAPSRGPQPAMFAGTAEASSTTSASGSSRPTGSSVPVTCTATTNTATWPITATVEANTMPGQARLERTEPRRSLVTARAIRVGRRPG